MKHLIGIAICLGLLLISPWELFFRKQAETGASEPETETTAADTLIPAHAQLFNSFSDLNETRRLDQTVERFMRQWQINGASLAIVKEGKLVYSKGYGYADVEAGKKTEVSHIFRIASVSKLITAAGIMKLVEGGSLSLDDRVFGPEGILCDSLYAEMADKRTPRITIDHLLRHQGGFSTRYTDPMFNPVEVARHMGTEPPADLTTIIRYVLKKRLGFTPGTSTSYSNVGYGILSRVIEQVTGQEYATWIRDSLLIPAGCYDMWPGRNLAEHRYPNEVKYYEPSDAVLIPACDGTDSLVYRSNGGNNIEALCGAGGWVASPTELLIFLQAIDGDPTVPDVLSDESIHYMTKNHAPGLPPGWMHTSSQGDWWRSGSLAGTSVMMKRQRNGFSWVFVTNTSSWSGSRFPSKIEQMVSLAISRIKEWPDRNLFHAEYRSELQKQLQTSDAL